MHREGGCFRRTIHQGIALQLADRFPAIAGCQRVSGYPHLQQRLRNRLRREPGQSPQQGAGRFTHLLVAGEPGGGQAAVVLHQPRLIPGQHHLTVVLPLAAVGAQAEASLADVSAGLLQCQGQAAQVVHRNRPGLAGVLCCLPAPTRCALQQKGGGVLWGEHLHLLELHRRAPVAQAGGDHQLAAAELGQQGFHLGRGLEGVDVVEDQQPAGVGLQPVERRLPLGGFFREVLLGQIERRLVAQAGEVAVQRLHTAGAHQQHRVAAADLSPGVLDRQAGFAHTARADQRQGAGGVLQQLPQVAAALEQRSNAREGQRLRPAGEAGCHQQIEHKGAQHLCRQMLLAAELDAGVAGHAAQPSQVSELQGLLFWVALVPLVPWRPVAGGGDEQPLAVPESQPGLPLGVGERGAIGLQKLRQRQAAGQLRIPRGDSRHRLGLSHRPRHIPHQVDHAIAALDVGVEHLQGFIAADDEVLLHLHLHIGAGEQVAQPLPVAQELSRDGGEEQLNPRHTPPACWWDANEISVAVREKHRCDQPLPRLGDVDGDDPDISVVGCVAVGEKVADQPC